MWSVIKTQGRGEILQMGDGGLVALHWHQDSGMEDEVQQMDKGVPTHQCSVSVDNLSSYPQEGHNIKKIEQNCFSY